MATTIAAEDGIEHAPSMDPEVHRPLIVVDPPMEGRDIANVQRSAGERLKQRGIGTDEVAVPDHGKFTLATALACIEAQYFLGLRSDTFLMKDRHGHRVLTAGAQQIIREPDTRTSDQLTRAQERHAQAARGPRFYEQLAVELGMTGRGAADALAYAAEHVGTKESPPKSNRGPLIDAWCKLAGYTPPVLWCGCFVNACIVAGGAPSGAPWGIGSTPTIVAHAQAKKGGWTWHAENGIPGDLALYDDDGPGGKVAVHVELVRKQINMTTYSTYGGNTSPGVTGGQADGGMVARHDDRSTTGGFRIIGFARPPYKH
jgi:hypothetical protein